MIHKRTVLSWGLALALLPALPPAASAGGAVIPGTLGTMEVQVDSLKTLRFRSVVPQQYDFSCGSAALATLLTYHYGRPTPETATFDGMYRTGDQALIQTQGFSMLDMKRYLEGEVGLSSDGFRLGLNDLEELGVPAITMIETEGYRHFVVIKGIHENQVLVGDPALGVQSYTLREFEEVQVNNILFIIRDELDRAQASFNVGKTWQAVTRAPLESGLARQSIANLMLHLPRAGEW
ncbi:hypothetical protein DFR31_2421 [Alkalispirillum mobile]|uniref:Peptidase C39 domain-containing protein n=1 Tax=Alkalispirillum mobile TaxID=85925 RepID=A0A498BT11_9GAMM|nr:C39 family peptidase [Alkalispirillum mobile]RLK47103.1 hypothetical protein DFR31_2421 [Alkalispirillum mobile]